LDENRFWTLTPAEFNALCKRYRLARGIKENAEMSWKDSRMMAKQQLMIHNARWQADQARKAKQCQPREEPHA
jgi:hypothetical protein